MNGRRAKLLRKQARLLHPEGSELHFNVHRIDKETGAPVSGNWYYTGQRRVYQDLKRAHYRGQTN